MLELVAAAVVGVLGWLLFAVSDWSPERTAGAVLLVAAALGLAAGATGLSAGARARPLALAGAAVLVLAGVVAALVVAGGPAGAGDVVLVLGVPAVCGLVLGLLALRSRR